MKTTCAWSHGGLIRGPLERRELALVFTGGDHGEGFPEVLRVLEGERVPGAFFFTGGFLRVPEQRDAARRAVARGHYVGPHSDQHLLYCSWEERERTLVTRREFALDLRANLRELAECGVNPADLSWWIPPFEWYNDEVSAWAREEGFPLCSFTPGTLSHADYTEDSAPNYRSNDEIYGSIFERESLDPHGLNGFLLLTHVGAGPGRKGKFFHRLDSLIHDLRQRGYTFRSLPELLSSCGARQSPC